jgi:acylphosphatase
MSQDARQFIVHGRVQGVGFRWWTRSLAVELELRGTVRNLDDGSVELVASGTDVALAELRTQLRRGPPGAVVERVEESGAPVPPERSGFHIAR